MDVQNLATNGGVTGEGNSSEVLDQRFCLAMLCSVHEVRFEFPVGRGIDSDAGVPLG